VTGLLAAYACLAAHDLVFPNSRVPCESGCSCQESNQNCFSGTL